MDQKNLEYLQKSLDYLGFGSHLNQVLEKAIASQSISFSIGFNQRYIPAEFRSNPDKGVDAMHFELKFNRSKTGDVYFLGAMEASLNRYDASPTIFKRFELEKHNRMSALQAYKLLCGQSFEKTIFVQDLDDLQENKNKKVSVWYKLDLKVTDKDGQHPLKWFFPEYGFDLESTFDRYAFSGMEDMQKRESSIKALRFGNLISLPLQLNEGIQQVYVAANPEFKNLDLYDQHLKSIPLSAVFPEPLQTEKQRVVSDSQEKEIQSDQSVYKGPKR